MAKVKCEYCGSYINDYDEKCSNCGAVNLNYQRAASPTPQTIEELKQWCQDRNLPPEEITRFFIGKNITEPKAFGIYEEDGLFIVYKNKANGQRTVRYCGKDETYAVNELYLRLKDEILNQKSNNLKQAKYDNYEKSNTRKNSTLVGLVTFIVWCTVISNIFFIAFSGISTGKEGYYRVNDAYYYRFDTPHA